MDFQKFIKSAYLLTPYSIIVALLYLISYWSAFDINIFEFVSIADIAKLTIYPLVIGLSVFIIGISLGNLQISYELKRKGTFKYWSNRKTTIFFLIMAIFLLCFQPIALFVLSAAVLSIIIHRIVINILPQSFNLFENKKLESSFILFAIAIPLLALAYGKIDSHMILSGKGVRYINSSVLANENITVVEKRLKYLGLKGDYYFFLSENNENIFISKTSKIPLLKLSKREYRDYEYPVVKLIKKIRSKR